MLTAPLFVYGFISGFSGTQIYHMLMYVAYNIVFTAAPILWFSTMDYEFDKKRLLNEPLLYKGGLYNVHFNKKVFLYWLFMSALQATGLLSITLADASFAASSADGKMAGMTETGDFVFCSIVLIVNIKLLVHSYQWSVGNLLIILASIVFYLLAYLFTSFGMPIFNHFGSFQAMVDTPNFWLGQFLFVFTFSTVDRVWYFWQ